MPRLHVELDINQESTTLHIACKGVAPEVLPTLTEPVRLCITICRLYHADPSPLRPSRLSAKNVLRLTHLMRMRFITRSHHLPRNHHDAASLKLQNSGAVTELTISRRYTIEECDIYVYLASPCQRTF